MSKAWDTFKEQNEKRMTKLGKIHDLEFGGTVTGRWKSGPGFPPPFESNRPKANLDFAKPESERCVHALLDLDLAKIERRIVAILPAEAFDACESNTPSFFEPSQPKAANVRQKKRAFVPIYGPKDKSGHRRVVGVREINPNAKP